MYLLNICALMYVVQNDIYIKCMGDLVELGQGRNGTPPHFFKDKYPFKIERKQKH